MKVGTAQTVDFCVYAENLGKSEMKTYVQLQYIFEHGTLHFAKRFIVSSGSKTQQQSKVLPPNIKPKSNENTRPHM